MSNAQQLRDIELRLERIENVLFRQEAPVAAAAAPTKRRDDLFTILGLIDEYQRLDRLDIPAEQGDNRTGALIAFFKIHGGRDISAEFEELKGDTSSHFRCIISLDGTELGRSGVAASKKRARENASRNVLRWLQREKNKSVRGSM